MKDTVILGLGSIIRGDDSVGIRVARLLKERFPKHLDIDIKESDEAGINLLDTLCGYRQAVVIDSIITEKNTEGTIHRIGTKELFMCRHYFSSHNIGLGTVIELAHQMDVAFPKDIVVFAVEIKNSCSFSEGVSKRVEEAVYRVANLIEKEFILSVAT